MGNGVCRRREDRRHEGAGTGGGGGPERGPGPVAPATTFGAPRRGVWAGDPDGGGAETAQDDIVVPGAGMVGDRPEMTSKRVRVHGDVRQGATMDSDWAWIMPMSCLFSVPGASILNLLNVFMLSFQQANLH